MNLPNAISLYIHVCDSLIGIVSVYNNCYVLSNK